MAVYIPLTKEQLQECADFSAMREKIDTALVLALMNNSGILPAITEEDACYWEMRSAAERELDAFLCADETIIPD